METSLQSEINSIWIMVTTFVIFLMQSGFALLESGCCRKKNQVNIMTKNVIDVLIGGLMFWICGYAFEFGTEKGSNPFIGVGKFVLNSNSGEDFLHFIFQLSFSSTAMTIVSGSVAERCTFTGYCCFCCSFFLVYCLPAGWFWRENGFLNQFGSIDYCGAIVIHLLGGTAALVAAKKLGPRIGRYDDETDEEITKPGQPVNSTLGMMLLWWGFLIFNSGSSYGTTSGLWIISSRAFITTLISSLIAGITALIYSAASLRFIDISLINNGILTGLVATTGSAAIMDVYDSIYVGVVAAFIACFLPRLIDYFQIDDPVNAITVHGGGGLWGGIVVGLCANFDTNVEASKDLTKQQKGLFKSGNFDLLGKQILAIIAVIVWTVFTVTIILYIIDHFIGLRMCKEEEIIGGDA